MSRRCCTPAVQHRRTIHVANGCDQPRLGARVCASACAAFDLLTKVQRS
jgi:hypothetical protein